MTTFYKLGLSFFSCPFSDYIDPSFNLLSMVYVWRMSNFFFLLPFYRYIHPATYSSVSSNNLLFRLRNFLQ
ncbi:hypothetical protein KSS87_002171, partial [Heliosperma pusillum]